MNEKSKKSLDVILIERGYSHVVTKEVEKRYNKGTYELYQMGKIDSISEDPNGEVVVKEMYSETVMDDIAEKDLDEIIRIENLKLMNENNKLLKQLNDEQSNIADIKEEMAEIKEISATNNIIVNKLYNTDNKIGTIKGIMIFWLVITIIGILITLFNLARFI